MAQQPTPTTTNSTTASAGGKRMSIQQLLIATRLGFESKIQSQLILHGLPDNDATVTQYFVLQTATKKNLKRIVEMLLNAGCRVNPCADDEGLTPLAMAIENENEEIAELLLRNGANMYSGKLTALHIAAERQSLKMLKLLLSQNNVDINCVRMDRTAFQMFFRVSLPYRQLEVDDDGVEIFKLFLSNGASLQVHHDWTVLHFVTTTANMNIIKMVLRASADEVNRQTSTGNTALHHLLQVEGLEETDNLVDVIETFVWNCGARIDIPNDDDELTACHLAAKLKFLRILRIFIGCDWNVNHRDAEGNATLHHLLENSSRFVASESYQQVISQILNMESIEFTENSLGKFPIHIAMESNQRQTVLDMLVREQNFDVNSRDARLDNFTILHFYLKQIIYGGRRRRIRIIDDLDVKIVGKLMSMGAQADIVNDDEDKLTPMHFALMIKDKTLLQLLLDKFHFHRFEMMQVKSILHYLLYNIDSSPQARDSTKAEMEAAEIVEFCIRRGANVNFKDERSRTPLTVAVLRRHEHIVRLLLENGAVVDDYTGRCILDNLIGGRKCVLSMFYPRYGTPIETETQIIKVVGDIERDTNILDLLASKGGMSLGMKSTNGFTIFHHAAAKKYTEMMTRLLVYMKHANATDPNGNTVLHTIFNSYAKDYKLEKIVSALLSKGASVTVANDRGEMPLQLAARSSNLKIVKLLLQHIADDVDAKKNDYGNSVVHYITMLNIETVNTVDVAKLMAVFVGERGRGCDVNAINVYGTTPLMMAVQCGCARTTRLLLQHGAKLDCITAAKDGYTPTLMHYAAKFNHPGVIEEIARFGADVNAKRVRDGATALHLSIHCEGSRETTRMLLLNGADAEIGDDQGRTALHWAAWYDRPDNIEELLIHGANVEAEDNFGVVPLLFAKCFNESWKKIHRHALKLRNAGILRSRALERYIDGVDEQQQQQQMDPYEMTLNDYINVALLELARMKDTWLDDDMNLADALRMSTSGHHLRRLNDNEMFQKLLISPKLNIQFPMYGDVIRAGYSKCMMRIELISLAKDALLKMIDFHLDENCCEKILNCLSDQDLRQLNRASTVKKRIKRKKIAKDRDEVCHGSAKRRRANF